MNKNFVLSLLILGGVILMVQSASAATIKIRPISPVTTPTPMPQPIVSAP